MNVAHFTSNRFKANFLTLLQTSGPLILGVSSIKLALFCGFEAFKRVLFAP